MPSNAVTGYALMTWARRMVIEHDLRPGEAAVLYALCSRAGQEHPKPKAYVSIERLARESGYKPRQKRQERKGQYGQLIVTTSWTCSSVSKHLDRLLELQLVWPVYRGQGKLVERQLLYVAPAAAREEAPAALREDGDQMPLLSVVQEGMPSSGEEVVQPLRLSQEQQEKASASAMPSAHAEGIQLPDEEDRKAAQLGRREDVRAAIQASLARAATAPSVAAEA